MRVEEEYMDVLHNMETVIIDVYREDPALLDYDVEAAITALISYPRQRFSIRSVSLIVAKMESPLRCGSW